MKDILLIAQIFLSVLLGLIILLQQRGSTLGSLAGGSSDGFRPERRGAEKLLFQLTILLAAGFCINAFALSFFGE